MKKLCERLVERDDINYFNKTLKERTRDIIKRNYKDEEKALIELSSFVKEIFSEKYRHPRDYLYAQKHSRNIANYVTEKPIKGIIVEPPENLIKKAKLEGLEKKQLNYIKNIGTANRTFTSFFDIYFHTKMNETREYSRKSEFEKAEKTMKCILYDMKSFGLNCNYEPYIHDSTSYYEEIKKELYVLNEEVYQLEFVYEINKLAINKEYLNVRMGRFIDEKFQDNSMSEEMPLINEIKPKIENIKGEYKKMLIEKSKENPDILRALARSYISQRIPNIESVNVVAVL